MCAFTLLLQPKIDFAFSAAACVCASTARHYVKLKSVLFPSFFWHWKRSASNKLLFVFIYWFQFSFLEVNKIINSIKWKRIYKFPFVWNIIDRTVYNCIWVNDDFRMNGMWIMIMKNCSLNKWNNIFLFVSSLLLRFVLRISLNGSYCSVGVRTMIIV